jgi:phenylalanyl-tRNA synthetase alpha chain
MGQKLLGKDTTKVGQGNAFRKKWISKEGAGFVRAVSCPVHLFGSETTKRRE